MVGACSIQPISSDRWDKLRNHLAELIKQKERVELLAKFNSNEVLGEIFHILDFPSI